MKNPVKTPAIDPGTVRLVAQRLNHYATAGPLLDIYRGRIYKRICTGWGRLWLPVAKLLLFSNEIF